MNNLAAIYQDEGRYPQAEALYSHVLEAKKRLLGPENSTTLTSVPIEKKVLGPDASNTAVTKYNMGAMPGDCPAVTPVR